MRLYLLLIFLVGFSEKETCSAKDRSCAVDDLNGLDVVKAKYSWVDYISPKPVVKREMPIAAKFRNFRNELVYEYYDNGTPEGTFLGQIAPNGGFGGSNTYTTHVFYFKNKQGKEVARFTMTAGQLMYIIPPNTKKIRKSEQYQKFLKESKFQTEYFDRMGQPWLSVYPRRKTSMWIWEADYVGQVHNIFSEFGYCSTPECTQPSEELDFKLTAVSLKPLVYIVEGALSIWETDHVLELALPRLGQSMIGQGVNALKSTTRTSKTAWLKRDISPALDQIFRRVADILNLEDHHLQHHTNAEHLQVVQYKHGENYGPHHDFSDDGTEKSRYLTFGIYLRTPTKGGYTSFPKAYGGKGLKARPPQGGAVLFYSLLPDGNGDDFSLHTGTHVLEGDKYFCNLWVWDPKR